MSVMRSKSGPLQQCRALLERIHSVNCQCGKPVEQAIEGKIVCSDCRNRSQMDVEERQINDEIALARAAMVRENAPLNGTREFKLMR